MGDLQDASRDDGLPGIRGQNGACGQRDFAQGAFVLMDAMRCVLAVSVAFAHAWYLLIEDHRGQASLTASIGYFLAGYAHASVILFFVLSGYWIARSVDGRIAKGWYWPSYLTDRLTRLLVVLLPALAIGGALDAIGLYVLESSTHTGATHTYVLRRSVADALGWRVFIGNILFLQDILVAPFGTNGPLWSLAYEFWFYIWFPAIIVSWRKRRPSPFLLAMGLAWIEPHMLIGFGCWLCGAALHWATRRGKGADRRPPLNRMWVGVASVVLMAMLIIVRTVGLTYLELALAAAFALFLYTLLRVGLSPPRWIEPLAAYGARASFSLYALHFPVLAFAAALLMGTDRLPPTVTNVVLVVLTLAWAVLVCGIFARYTEHYTGKVRRLF